MENYEVGKSDADWPNNLISRRAVVYNDGTIGLAGQEATHEIDAAELSLCESLAAQAATLMTGSSVGMGSEADDQFAAFFVAAPMRSVVPPLIHPELIRERFGGTLFPLATITVEPFAEDTVWWGEVATDGAGSPSSYFEPWRAMMAWFKSERLFRSTAFVRVGDALELSRLPEEAYPRGTVMPGCVLPRMALGLTHKGSLAGIFGYVVAT